LIKLSQSTKAKKGRIVFEPGSNNDEPMKFGQDTARISGSANIQKFRKTIHPIQIIIDIKAPKLLRILVRL
jgi:hypothetical protein